VVQAGTAFRAVRDRMQAIAREREQQAERMAARDRKRERERTEGGLTL
jgi:hypothetical protein